MKKLLILGGKPIGSCEIVEKAKELGIYTIVADYLPKEQSCAKRFADEEWLISTADIDILEQKAREAGVNGVVSGVHEFNIEMAIILNERLGTPNVCNLYQWQCLTNKEKFKELCKANNIPITEQYDYKLKEEIEYPVICKPCDSSGSRGFSICKSINELIEGYNHALDYSPSKTVLIEKYMPFDSVIIHYTIINGNAFFSGMADKVSMLLEGGASVMAMQTFPSKNADDFLLKLDKRTQKMFKELNLQNGVAWIEAFNNNGEFTYNEMGYRFGGSLTYYPVEYYTGYNQLEMLINYAVGNQVEEVQLSLAKRNFKYAILPFHVKAGHIKEIYGEDVLISKSFINAYVPVHFLGDTIENWGSAQQVMCYIHILYGSSSDLKTIIDDILNILHVKDDFDNELLFCLYLNEKTKDK